MNLYKIYFKNNDMREEIFNNVLNTFSSLFTCMERDTKNPDCQHSTAIGFSFQLQLVKCFNLMVAIRIQKHGRPTAHRGRKIIASLVNKSNIIFNYQINQTCLNKLIGDTFHM